MSKILSSLLLALTPSLLPKTSENKLSKAATTWRILLVIAVFYLVLPAGCMIFSESSKEYSQCVSEISSDFADSVDDTILGDANGIL